MSKPIRHITITGYDQRWNTLWDGEANGTIDDAWDAVSQRFGAFHLTGLSGPDNDLRISFESDPTHSFRVAICTHEVPA